MTKVLKISVLFILTISVAFIWVGCSETNKVVVSGSGDGTAEVSDYFPLQSGLGYYFTVVNNAYNDTSTYLYSIGDPTVSNGRTVYPWVSRDTSFSTFTETGYFYYDDDALYYFENATENPEKILEEPFEAGRYWYRYSLGEAPDTTATTDDPYDPFSDYGDKYGSDEEEGGGGGKDGDGQGSKEGQDDRSNPAKSYPTSGSNYFALSAIEDVNLTNDNDYDDCIKVENTSNGKYNYYWYAKGVGLVKFALGVDEDNYPDGEVIGELIYKK